MKPPSRLYSVLASVLLSYFATSFGMHAASVRILPVGDSITLGVGAAGGFRAPLYQLLTNAGYTVDFLGTQTGNGVASLPDSNHEGYGGYLIEDIDSVILNSLNSVATPDIILLLIGTNDYGDGHETATATNRLEALIVKMANFRPTTRIIVANLLVRNEPYNAQIQSTFNPFLPAICERLRAMGHQVYFQDLRSAITAADLLDTVHPNQLGYNKLATNWFSAVNTLLCPNCPATFSLIPTTAMWRYLDNGTDQGTAWRQTNFNDSAWASGLGQMGYGDGDEATMVNSGPSGSRFATTYFRHTFVVTNRASITNVAVRLLRDDGGVVYLNGVEVFRSNMPEAPIAYNSWSAVSISGSEENSFFVAAISPALLRSGTNVLAAEVHQADPGSSDMSFHLELLANTVLGNLPPIGIISVTPSTQIVASNEMFLLNIMASDAESGVPQIDMLQDGVPIGSLFSSSASFNWSSPNLGIRDFLARPRDTEGMIGSSAPARVLVTRPGFQGQSVFFPQFTSASGLIVQNNATISSNVLHLTQALGGSRGGAWIATPQNVLGGFVSEFRFRIISKVGGGGDGFCFNVAGTAQPNIGTSVGYSGITNSLSVEFDTYQNTSAADPDDHHISVHSRGLLANTSDESASLGIFTPPADFSDGNVHRAKIEYVPGVLRVYLDNLNAPVLSVNVNLGTLLSLPNGNAWIGLAAGSGSSFEYHDISAWSYTSFANVPPTVSLSAPATALRVAPGTDLALTASATDPNGSVVNVEFYDGSELIGATTNAPFSVVWSNLSAGIHTITAVARDDGGLFANSAPLVVAVGSTNAPIVLFPDFSNASNVTVQGSAAVTGNRLRLTSALPSQIGGAWLSGKQFVQYGFETVFQFQIAQLGGNGADGLAFVIQDTASPLLGNSGAGIGYSSIPKSLAIEFDTYLNAVAQDPNANHVGIHSRGTLANSTDENASLGNVSPLANLSDGAIHTAAIRYAAGSMLVFLDDFTLPLLSVPVNLQTLLALENGEAWVGFTASTGSDFENHDLLMWSFRSVPTPVRLEQAQVENNGAVAFRFFAATGQTYTVEYSTNLVNWIDAVPSITGAGSILVWRDNGPPGTASLPATQPQRFYRVRVKQ